MYLIRKKFKFDAAHQLLGLPTGHKCGNVHGHTYNVEVALSSTSLTAEGWVMDFGDLNDLGRFIDEHVDHKNLNEVFDFQTTSENLAKYFFDRTEELLLRLERLRNQVPRVPIFVAWVRVSETESTYAEYRR